ncbi:XRE family transcriptional regulator [Salipiger sp. IMCC34102]|uniref:helix-turn-helix domain-containing protein n=1 Tax=Salipiger sp. IMCC34102 TaxID=2510647 RepID=UPI00101D1576|nr:helix-turn-helix domain-containing protein [Salipiger sp. IMCC34102]RYH02539.1 XRE family transcriptional regulator [Salipiger sp. IMCC34102]
MISIEPKRLNQIRRARGLGRPRLAKLSGLTERQIARLEGAISSNDGCTEDVLVRLASALQVQPDTLTGSEPLTTEDIPLARPSRGCGCC